MADVSTFPLGTVVQPERITPAITMSTTCIVANLITQSLELACFGPKHDLFIGLKQRSISALSHQYLQLLPSVPIDRSYLQRPFTIPCSSACARPRAQQRMPPQSS